MATPVYATQTLGVLTAALIRRIEPGVPFGDANDGSSTTITFNTAGASPLANFGTDDAALINRPVYVYAGVVAGEYAYGTTYVSGTRVLTVKGPGFTGTGPDSTSRAIIPSLFEIWDYQSAITEAQRMLNFDKATQRGVLLERVGREIILGNAIVNGGFDLFTTANVPDGWTLDGNSTFTEENTITMGRRRCLRMVTDGAAAGFLRQPILQWGRFVGLSVVPRLWVRASTASRVTFELADGTGTATSTTLSTDNEWEYIELADRTISDAATQLQPSVEVSSGSAVTVETQYMYLPEAVAGAHEYAFDADRRIVAVAGNLRLSEPTDSTNDGGWVFKREIRARAWEVVLGSPRRMRLHLNGSHSTRTIEYTSWENHLELTAVNTVWTGPPDAILDVAEAIMHRRQSGPGSDDTDVKTAISRVLRNYGTSVAVGKVLEPN